MAPSSPRVTIVVPVHNAEAFLGSALASIVAQTFADREILVMDDASTDGSPGIAASFGDHVTLVRQERNRGQFGNVQEGIARARGEFVAVYHADDVYDPTIVEKEVAYLDAHPEAGAVFCLDRFMDADGTVYGKLTIPEEVRSREPLAFETVLNALLVHRNRFLRTPGAMVRRRVYEEVGPYRSDRYSTAADLDMWLRIARRHPIGIIEEHLFSYRHTERSEGHRTLHVATRPDLSFAVIDDHLAEVDGGVVRPEARMAYEAHRQEDRLLIAVNHYIRDEIGAMRKVVAELRLGAIVRSPRVERWRLLVLFVVVVVLSRMPRSGAIAQLAYRRWHVRRWRNRA